MPPDGSRLRQIKDIHRFTGNHLRGWFPLLPSYQAFNNRINRLSSVFAGLGAVLIEDHLPADADTALAMTDSMPVVTCAHKRRPRVATGITAKGYNATKGTYYHGLKVHISGYRRAGTMPFPYSVVVSPANESDLAVFREAEYHHGPAATCLGDKAYCDGPYFKGLRERRGVEMLTPVKAIRGQGNWEKAFDKAAADLYSKAVSSLRQPLESLNNWIIEHSGIQMASKVRSTKGLLVHVFGKLAAAFCSLIFNP